MAVRGKPRLPWLLLLVAVTAVLPTNAVYSGNDYRAIIRNAIERYPELAEFPTTPDHPTGKQFAMMIAIPPQDYITGNTNIQLDPPPTWQKGHHYPVEPSVIGNYLVARPDTSNEALQRGGVRQHAEIKLLNKLNELLTKFNQKYGRPPAVVLLYTWFTPCPDCTNFILQTKRNSYQKFHLAVLYSVNKQMPRIGMTYKSNEENRQKLRDVGIPVFDVDLPSIGGGYGGGKGGGGKGGGGVNGGASSYGGGVNGGRSSSGGGGKLQLYHSSFTNTLPVQYNPSWNLPQNQVRQTFGGYGSNRRFPMYTVRPTQFPPMNTVRPTRARFPPMNTVRPTLRPNTNNWFKMLKRFPFPRGG